MMNQTIQNQNTKASKTIGSHPRSWLKRTDGTPIPAKHSLVEGKAKKAPKPAQKIPAVKPAAKPAKTPKAKPAKKAPSACLCGCGTQVARSFAQGHDARVHGQALRVLKGEMKASEMKGLKIPACVEWLRTRSWVDVKMRAALGISLKG
jgi:hypothetical protein